MQFLDYCWELTMTITAKLTRPFQTQGGFSYSAKLPQAIWQIAKNGGVTLLLEDGKPLGPRDSLHKRIRDVGGGQYSVWTNRQIYFSSSDGSDCNRNGREYSLTAFAQDDPTYQEILSQIAVDPRALLSVLGKANEKRNDFLLSFFGNFFEINAVLDRNNIKWPRSVLEIASRPQALIYFAPSTDANKTIVHRTEVVHEALPSRTPRGRRQG